MTPESTSVSGTSLVLAAVLLFISTYLWLAYRRWHAGWLRRRQWSRAQKAEAHAPMLLERLGYIVLGAQVEATYSLLVDGQSMPISVRADYLVSRHGRRFVAEVKSGRLAPLLATPTTRRQLLEYLVAFQADGVLLVDGETRTVHEVGFPVPSRARLVPGRSAQLGWMAVGVAAVAALAWMLRVW
jgi:hypothetical protein